MPRSTTIPGRLRSLKPMRCLAALCLPLGACAGGGDQTNEQLTPEAFVSGSPEVRSGNETAGGPAIRRAVPAELQLSPPVVSTPGQTPPGPTLQPGLLGAADSALGDPEPVLVDAKVGEINGRPIFVNDFFSGMDALLRTKADELPRNEWMQTAYDAISRRVQEITQEELLVAQMRAALTEQQGQGLRAFLAGFRQDLLRQSRGSRTLAERAALESQGLTLDQMVRQREQKLLIGEILRTIRERHTHVTRRDIAREHARQGTSFSPNPTAVFRVVQAPAADAHRIEAVSRLLSESDDPRAEFADIASSDLNSTRRDQGGRWDIEFTGQYEQAEFFPGAAFPNLNAAARGLSPGRWAGPIMDRESVSWILLEEIRDRSVSQYEAQLYIENQMRFDLQNRELDEYFRKLQGPQAAQETQQLVLNLLEIAARRYLDAPG